MKAAATHLACRKPDEPIEVPGLPPVKLASELLREGLLNVDSNGQWWLRVPVSRFSSAIIAWLLVALGIVARISVQTVSRWLKSEKIKPWRFRTWITTMDLSTFLPRARAVLDLYARIRHLGPTEIAWSSDEKTSIQGRSRSHHEPCQPGRLARVENTYARQGAVQFLAALNVLTGKVLGIVRENKKFIQFQDLIHLMVKESVSLGKTTIHLILDNGSTHRPKYLERWLDEAFPDLTFHVHWLPVHASWLNQVEIFFSKLQTGALTPNNFSSLADLTRRILEFVGWSNIDPKPIDWTYTTNQLYSKYGRDPQSIW